MQYFNIIVIGALVLYLVYKIYEDIQLGIKDNMTFRILLLLFGLGILIYRVIKLRRQ